jgi:hypothetical protein
MLGGSRKPHFVGFFQGHALCKTSLPAKDKKSGDWTSIN